jgi:hypothetical protein
MQLLVIEWRDPLSPADLRLSCGWLAHENPEYFVLIPTGRHFHNTLIPYPTSDTNSLMIQKYSVTRVLIINVPPLDDLLIEP